MMRHVMIFGPAMLVLGSCIPGPRAPRPVAFAVDSVQSVDVVFVGGAKTYCLYGDAPALHAVVQLADGRRLGTPRPGETVEDRVELSRFEWTSDFGTVDEEGRLRLPMDPFAHLGRTVTVRARLVDRPEVAASAQISAQFGCAPRLSARGAGGPSGSSGLRGQSGAPGRSGDSATQAGDGGPGGSGGHGEPGQRGQDGGALVIALTYFESTPHGRLVLAREGEPAGGRYTLYAPGGDALVADASGGDGGAGGGGGDGGSGGAGGSNNIQGGGDGGHGGDGGNGGTGGDGGDGGNGGQILVLVDARYPELEAAVQGFTDAGRGGTEGRGGYGGSLGPGGSSASGRRGQDGRPGQTGPAGRPGRSGTSGPTPQMQAVAVDRLFAAEIAAGMAIAAPGSR